ncbi:hypothetical protein [Desulfogranum japonicum]|uniref:hypothetical protein n=1 Tax=Desulfogranum japonicum TaxID=231447 RepID=UPI00048EEF4E|nr:hypothetical protein [Desulfogranum japonicum]
MKRRLKEQFKGVKHRMRVRRNEDFLKEISELIKYEKDYRENVRAVKSFAVKCFNEAYGNRKVWPVDYKWYNNREWLKNLRKRFKSLDSLLIELHKNTLHRDISMSLLPQECMYDEHGTITECLALINPQKYKMISENIGCSEDTLKKYMTGLVRCGVLKEFNRGTYGRLFSIGYHVKQNGYSWRKIKLLNGKTVSRLKNFQGSKG